MSPRIRKARRAWAAVTLLFLLSACAKNPATGKRELMLVGEGQEIAMGRQAAEQIPVELGFIEDRRLEQYVAEKGLAMAGNSERPELPWEFHVVDSPVVNAFALPGGFIYFTRGILAHMNSEAEMVGVLGHEIGHVTARHSAQQMSKAQLATLGFGVGMIFVPEARPYGDLLQTGVGLMFLKFGRDDELEADRLGIRYALEAGYDARRTAAFFDVLDRLNEQSGRALPGWLSTHPNPRDRGERILEISREASVDLSNLTTGEERFKRRLEGLIYGDNPREGFMDGRTFKHPDLRFQIQFPEGWQVQNTRQAVYAGSRNAAFRLTLSRVAAGSRPEAHAAQVFRQFGLQAGREESTNIGGFPAFVVPFRAQTPNGVLDGEAAFLRDGENMYELFAYTTPDRYRRLRPTFRSVIASFGRLRDRAALTRQPDRLHLYQVPRSTTLRNALSDAGVPKDRLEEFALVNQGRLDESVRQGALLKAVRVSRRSTRARP